MQQGEGLKSRSPRQIQARSWHHTAQAWASGFLKTYKMGIMIPAFIHAFTGQIFIKYLQCIGHCARKHRDEKQMLLSWSLNSMRRVRQQNILKENIHNMSEKCYREK